MCKLYDVFWLNANEASSRIMNTVANWVHLIPYFWSYVGQNRRAGLKIIERERERASVCFTLSHAVQAERLVGVSRRPPEPLLSSHYTDPTAATETGRGMHRIYLFILAFFFFKWSHCFSRAPTPMAIVAVATSRCGSERRWWFVSRFSCIFGRGNTVALIMDTTSSNAHPSTLYMLSLFVMAALLHATSQKPSVNGRKAASNYNGL